MSQIWRAGYIIQADYIFEMLEPVPKGYASRDSMKLLFEYKFAEDLKKAQPALKKVVLACVEAGNIGPTLSCSLEYIKYMSSVGS